MTIAMRGRRLLGLIGIGVVLVACAMAWVDAGREPVRALSVDVPLPPLSAGTEASR